MKIFYILILFTFIHCSSSIEFSIPAEDSSLLSSEEEMNMDESVSESSSYDVSQAQQECETFSVQKKETPLDILFVLDVSLSMRANLEKLGVSMGSLLTYIEDFDWRMAFTTADHGDHTKVNGHIGEQRWEDYEGDLPHFGQLMPLEYRGNILTDQFLSKQTHFYKDVFYDTLTLNRGKKHCNGGLPPFCQGGHEQPLRSLQSAMERDENRGFFRENSDFIAIVVTNEDERVEDSQNATTAQDIQSTFESLFSSDKNFYGFGIIVKDRQCLKEQDRRSTRSAYSSKVAELAEVTHGRNISICDRDFGPALKGVSKLIQDRVLDNIQLKNHPIEQSVQVNVSSHQNLNWQVQGRHILFDQAIHEDTEVQICYNF